MRIRRLIPILLAAASCVAGGCQLHPRPVDAMGEPMFTGPSSLPYHVTDMRVQTIPATAFLYQPVNSTFAEIAEPATRSVMALQKLMSQGQAKAKGSVLFVYADPSEDVNKPLDLQIGLPVQDFAAAPADFQVRTLPAFHCATVFYRGPIKLLPKAYEKLLPEMIAAGYTPSDETRESYVVWESANSPKNVVQIEVGIR